MTIAAGIFRLNDIRGVVDRDLTVEAARAIGGAYAALMRERGVVGEVAVGRDNRPSGTKLRDALVAGLTMFYVSMCFQKNMLFSYVSKDDAAKVTFLRFV